MNIIKPTYTILTNISPGAREELKHIEEVARTCYKSENLIKDESAEKMIRALINSNHEAMLEHSTLCIKFYIDRGISHEIVRHRMSSFAQESTRYCCYSDDKFNNEVNYINIKDAIKYDDVMNKLPKITLGEIIAEWLAAMTDSEEHYLRMIELGATPQMARSVLPNSTKTELVMTANYREWRHFFKLRTHGVTGKPHPQMLELTIPLLKELQEKIPIIFDDIKVPVYEDIDIL